MTGGAEINFGGTREVYVCEFERGTEAQKIYSSVDQTNKMETKKKGLQFKNFPNSGYRFKILANFHEFLSEDQKKKKDLRPKTLMKSGVSPQKLRKYRR